VLLTEWNEFRALNMVRVGNLLRRKLIIDLRNVYAPEQMRAYGFDYVSIGRMPVSAAAKSVPQAIAAE
jgi:UDPglucose 6-dehydrogenase